MSFSRRFLTLFLPLVLILTLLPGKAEAAGEKDYSLKADPSGFTPAVETAADPDCSLTEEEVYQAIIALKEEYPEGMPWTNANSYHWNINYTTGYGCAGFAFLCSDAAFGYLPSRTVSDGITISDLRVGDILRVNGNSHSVVVLEVHDDYIVLCEGNFNSSIHWGRTMSASEVARVTDYYYTRYPEHRFVDGMCVDCGAVQETPAEPEEPQVNYCGDNVTWTISSDGVLTISGTGPMWDFPVEYPGWYDYADILTHAVIEDGVTSIGDYAFYQCFNLKSIEMANSVTSIGEGAFVYAPLAEMKISGNLVTIEHGAFNGCRLTSVTIPATVTYLGDLAFGNHTTLREVKFLGNAPTIHQNAFGETSTTCYYPAGNGTWTQDLLLSYGGSITWEATGAEPPEPTTPAVDPTEPVVMPTEPPQDSTSWPVQGTLDNITWKLTEDGTLTISGQGAMPYCEMEADVPWLSYADDIRSVVLENGITTVGPYAFHGCYNLTTVSIPQSVTVIEKSAFYDCIQLTGVKLPAGLQVIGPYAFYRCEDLRSLNMGDKLTTIERYAFNSCRSLSSVTIPASVTEIGTYCFQSCEDMVFIKFLGDAPRFAANIFPGYPKITGLYPAGNGTWDGVAVDSSSVSWVAINPGENVPVGESQPVVTAPETPVPSGNILHSGSCGESLTWHLHDNGVLEITGTGDMANSRAVWDSVSDSITAVIVRDGVTSISSNAFSSMDNLSMVSISASVREVGKGAFGYCYKLRTVIFEGNAPYIGYKAFSDNTLTCYYPVDYISSWGIDSTLSYGGMSVTWKPYQRSQAPAVLTGDVNGNGTVTSDDAIHLLYHTLFGESMYPVNQSCDFNGDGSVTSDDAIHLLYHTLFGDALYPLH